MRRSPDPVRTLLFARPGAKIAAARLSVCQVCGVVYGPRLRAQVLDKVDVLHGALAILVDVQVALHPGQVGSIGRERPAREKDEVAAPAQLADHELGETPTRPGD